MQWLLFVIFYESRNPVCCQFDLGLGEDLLSFLKLLPLRIDRHVLAIRLNKMQTHAFQVAGRFDQVKASQ